MRTTGYIMVIVGFFWLFLADFDSGASLRSLDKIYREKYPYTNNYSGEQLHEALIEVVRDYRSDVPRVMPPAIFDAHRRHLT